MNIVSPTGLAPACASAAMVHVVEDDPDAFASIAAWLCSQGLQVRHYPACAALLDRLPLLEPGCILLDMGMPDMSGLTLQAKLREHGCAFPVVLLTGCADVAVAVAAMKAGAIDVLLKPARPEALREAVGAALDRLIDRAASDAEVRDARARIANLSGRERDVMARLVSGASNKGIAQALGISPRTVEIHRAHMMEKLRCRSLPEVVILAMRAGAALG